MASDNGWYVWLAELANDAPLTMSAYGALAVTAPPPGGSPSWILISGAGFSRVTEEVITGRTPVAKSRHALFAEAVASSSVGDAFAELLLVRGFGVGVWVVRVVEVDANRVADLDVLCCFGCWVLPAAATAAITTNTQAMA